MDIQEFEANLTTIATLLQAEAIESIFKNSKAFEDRVREIASDVFVGETIDLDPAAQAFPDIAIGSFGIEVKFTEKDTWRSVANSVLETNRVDSVSKVYVIFGKMGGTPEVRWDDYEKCVMHVRTSHVPRFELEIGASQSLFEQMAISYDAFRHSEMHDKMEHIRKYARGRLKPGERLWWLEDSKDSLHSLPIQARLYTKLSMAEKTRMRAEAILLCPQIVNSGRSRDKYDDVVLYLLTYHGVLCHQARDLFSAGSVANPKNDDNGGIYIQRSISLIEKEIIEASMSMDAALFIEYWGEDVPPEKRIGHWLMMADRYAKDWVPSATLFLNNQ